LQTEAPAEHFYECLWPLRARVTRLLGQRHAARRAAGQDATHQQWQELLETRRQIGHLVLRPGPDLAVRDQSLRRLTRQKEKLEAGLARALPEQPRQQELAGKGPANLARLLPRGSLFVDLLRYWHTEKGKQPAWSHLWSRPSAQWRM